MSETGDWIPMGSRGLKRQIITLLSEAGEGLAL
jgi:hypothetical protein